MQDIFSLEGKVALVTGGSRGMGREMVLAFAKAGADVAIVSRKIEGCEEVAREVEALGRKALPYSCHVGKWDQIDEMIEAVYKHFGHVDILVNNAGMSPVYETIMDVSEQMYDSVYNLNLKGPFRLIANIGTRMAAGNGGSIINVSSIAGKVPKPIEIPYGGAKAGLNNFSIGFARYFAPKVRVNSIMPGPFMTDIAKAWDQSMFDHIAEVCPLGRPGQPNEIVGAALFLASDASSFVTGHVLTVDGGTSI